MTRAVFLVLAAFPILAAETDPAAIMAKVAANMEAGAAARRQFVYQQRVKATITQSNGKVNRREERFYTVLPHEKSTEKKLDSFKGEYRDGNKMVAYTTPHDHGEHHDHYKKGEEGIAEGVDGEIIEDLVKGLVDDKKSPDGIPRDLFPLRADVLAGYQFTSRGEREFQGRRVLKIGFEPLDKNGLCVHVGSEQEDGTECQPWEGEAWIDAQEYFPVRIDTKLARGIPWAVRAFLGTNIKQLGFSVSYVRAGEGAWFPATYGTEFKLNVLFFYKRTISLSLESSDFKRTETSSTVEFVQ